MANTVDTVQKKIQKTKFTAVADIITPSTDLAVRPINSSTGRNAASVTEFLKLGKCLGVTKSFENLSERNNTFYELIANDETRKIFPGGVSNFLVSDLH